MEEQPVDNSVDNPLFSVDNFVGIRVFLIRGRQVFLVATQFFL